jgi:hypothetical protein
MLRRTLLLLFWLFLAGACTSPSATQRERTLEELRRDLELPSEDWDFIVALAEAHTGYVISKAARVSNNTIYLTLKPSNGDAKKPGPTLVFVRSGKFWVENNVFNDEAKRGTKHAGPSIQR